MGRDFYRLGDHPYSKYRFWFLEIPSKLLTDKGDILSLEDNCLLAALISAYENLLFLEKEPSAIRVIRGFRSLNPKLRRRAFEYLIKETEVLKDELSKMEGQFSNVKSLPRDGPFRVEQILPLFCEMKNVQVHIFTVRNRTKLQYSFPPEYDPLMRQIYLFNDGLDPSGKTSHVYAILNIESFYNRFGAYCFHCQKVKARLNRHSCKPSRQCFACRRFFILPGMAKEAKEDTHCDSILLLATLEMTDPKTLDMSEFKTDFNPERCLDCNLVLSSESCKKVHLKSSCKRGYFCTKCKIYLTLSAQYPTQKDLKNHNCGSVLCRYCRRYIDPIDHGCQMSPGRYQKIWPRLSFIFGSKAEELINICESCQGLQDQNDDLFLLCEKHQDKEINKTMDLNGLVILEEESERGKFSRKTFFPFNQESCEAKYEFANDYFPKEYTNVDKERISDWFLKQSNQEIEMIRDHRRIELKDNPDFVDNFLKYILDLSKMNTTYVCNGSLELGLLAARLTDYGISCQCLFKSRVQIIAVEMIQYRIKIINSQQYFPRPLFDLWKNYRLESEIPFTFFPHIMNHKQNYDYEGNIPDLNMFTSKMDSEDEERAKVAFLMQQNIKFSEEGKKWNFKRELLDFATNQLEILVLLTTNFIARSFEVQKSLVRSNTCINKPKASELEILHPLGERLCSLASFSYCIFKTMTLDPKLFLNITSEFRTGQRDKVSRGEHEFVSYVASKRKDIPFQTAFSHIEGQKVLKFGANQMIKPDMYYFDKTQGKMYLYMFQGCQFHPHNKNCLQKKKPGKENFLGSLMQELGEKYSKKLSNFKEEISKEMPNVEIVMNEIFECHWDELKKNDEDVRAFMLKKTQGVEKYHKRPLLRLNLRTSLMGPPSEVYQFFWEKVDGRKLEALDVNSLYPFLAWSESYPCGKFHTIIGKDIEKLHIVQNKIVYNGSPLKGGFIQVRILAPNKLNIPFLLYKCHGGRSFASLCRTCLEKERVKKCLHKEESRAWTSVYSIAEVNFAISLGYRVLDIYEVIYYEEFQKVFAPFFQQMFRQRLMYSGYPKKTTKTEDDKTKYCDKMNGLLGLTGRQKLKVDDISDNPVLKEQVKLMMNSSLGKLAQTLNKTKHILCHDEQDLENVLLDQSLVARTIDVISDNVLQVTAEPKNYYLGPNRSGSAAAYSYLLSYARIYMYENIKRLEAKNMKIIYCDIDSLIFERQANQDIPLPISQFFGDFKPEYEGHEILQFYSLGPKTFKLILQDKSGVLSHKTKLRSFALESKLAQESLGPPVYEELFESAMEGNLKTLPIPQQRNHRKHISASSRVVVKDHNFSNRIPPKRILMTNKDNEVISLPYGTKK